MYSVHSLVRRFSCQFFWIVKLRHGVSLLWEGCHVWDNTYFLVEVLCTPRVVLPCKNGAMLETALFLYNLRTEDVLCSFFGVIVKLRHGLLYGRLFGV